MGDVDPGGVANLYGLWDWVGMAPRMGRMIPVRAYSLWAGLCPENLAKQNKPPPTITAHTQRLEILVIIQYSVFCLVI